MNIATIIKPENDLERLIIRDPEFIEGVQWGKPRKGHDEGKVIYHIEEVLANVDKYANEHNRVNLRLITIIHDTFKNKVDTTKDRSGENHHAMIARRFAEKYITDPIVLDIIELHDEGYNSFCIFQRDPTKEEKAKSRALKLISRLDKLDITALDLYLTFYRCDNNTASKEQTSLEWFEKLVI